LRAQASFSSLQSAPGIKEFNRLVSQALQNGFEVYGVFGEGKLYLFYYRRSCSLFLLVE
jgi:hypothetical protein